MSFNKKRHHHLCISKKTARPASVFTRNHTLRLFSSISSLCPSPKDRKLMFSLKVSSGICLQSSHRIKLRSKLYITSHTLTSELIDWQQMYVRDTWPDGTNRSNDPTCMRQQVHSTETSGKNWAALGAKPDCTGILFFLRSSPAAHLIAT